MVRQFIERRYRGFFEFSLFALAIGLIGPILLPVLKPFGPVFTIPMIALSATSLLTAKSFSLNTANSFFNTMMLLLALAMLCISAQFIVGEPYLTWLTKAMYIPGALLVGLSVFIIVQNSRYGSALRWERKGEAGIDELTSLMYQDNHFIGGYRAAQMLGKVGNPRAVALLIEALQSDDFTLRIMAAQALGLVADEQAIPALEAVAGRKEDDEPYNQRIAEVVDEAIANIQAGPDQQAELRYNLNKN